MQRGIPAQALLLPVRLLKMNKRYLTSGRNSKRRLNSAVNVGRSTILIIKLTKGRT